MNYKLLIISITIILLLVLLIFSLRNNFSENFEYSETKEVYRLADILRNSSICYNENNCKNYSINLNRIVNDYPNSLAAYYINNNYNERLENGKYIINNDYDLSLLVKILKAKKLLSNDSNDSNNYVAIHIRLGDVLCGPKKMGWIKKRSIYNPHDMIKKILNYYKHNNVSKHLPVKIFTFYHKDHWTKEFDTDNCIVQKSEEYLKTVTIELSRNNITNVTIYNNRFPDDDVVDCVNAKHFISSAGNFSKLILDLRKLIY